MNCRNTFSNRVKKTYIIGEISIYSCFGKYISGKANGFTRDGGEGITIAWNTSGKVRSVTGGSSPLDFSYSALGQRQIKAYLTEGGKASDYYIHDATGNIMAIYTLRDNYNLFQLKEQHIYGSGRLGIYNRNIEIYPSEEVLPLSFTRGVKRYELSNHLGNVNSVISDRKVQTSTAGSYLADIKSYVDYYPFGYQIPERTWSSSDYRFGFNGQEKDDEIYGEGAILSFEFRNYDNRLGRFWSVDPLAKDYPFNSPYDFAENSPIAYGELEGLERYFAPTGKYLGQRGKSNQIRIVAEKEVKNYNTATSDYLLKVSTLFHSSSESAQSAVAGTIYREVSQTPLKKMKVSKEDRNSAASVNPNNPGEMTIYPNLAYGISGEFINDDYYNQINVWYHEELHNKGRTGSPFDEFDINKLQMTHKSYPNTTPAFKNFLQGVMSSNLVDQGADLGARLRNLPMNKRQAEVNKPDFQKYLKKYNENVDYYNQKFNAQKKHFNFKLYIQDYDEKK